MSDTAWRALIAAAVLVGTLTGGIAWLATTAPTEPIAQSSNATTVPAADGFSGLHEQGLTGANVSVGVIEVTGFDTDTSALSGRVSAAQAFGTDSIDPNGADHGTAAATVVARTAPDADLYLANVGGIDGYVSAIEWLREQDVDVIVAPVSFYGQPGDGSGPVGTATTEATDAGIVFVAPSGNLATAHWQGNYSATAVTNGTVTFANDSQQIAIDGPTDVTVWLSWDEAHADEDYTVELYRTDVAGSRLIARSQPYPADETPNERIVADVSPGQYALVVRGPDEPTGANLRLVSPTHGFEYANETGSIVAPGTAHGALTVGAYNNRTGAVEPISSHGPTTDGRVGVDVVAPNRQFADLTESGFVGSSVAAPYVAGVVTLMLEADGSLSPTATELLVELTATDIGRPGVDYASGHGVVEPVPAVRAAGNETVG